MEHWTLKGLSLILLLAAALFAADPPWEKKHLLVGQALYRNNCVVCHSIDRPQSQSKKLGPSFYQLFKRDKMPIASMKPSRDYIKVRVKFGGAIMPAFGKTLTDGEIDNLIDYIASR
jgi:mono/diheme cytochrome c family protein